MQAISPASTLQPSVSLLEKTPAILELLLDGIPEDILDWKPAPERWSIAEVLAHLLDIERLYAQRAKRMVVDDNPTLTKYVPGEGDGGKARRGNTFGTLLPRAVHIFSSGTPFPPTEARGPAFIRKWAASHCCSCSTNWQIMILAICARSPSFTAPKFFIPSPVHSSGTRIRSHERTSRRLAALLGARA